MSAQTYVNRFVMASRRRLRPVLLTMLTTIFSMLPLALGIGEGSETWSPLARAVIGGLFFASIFTLFVVPVMLAGISPSKVRLFKQARLEDREKKPSPEK